MRGKNNYFSSNRANINSFLNESKLKRPNVQTDISQFIELALHLSFNLLSVSQDLLSHMIIDSAKMIVIKYEC